VVALFRMWSWQIDNQRDGRAKLKQQQQWVQCLVVIQVLDCVHMSLATHPDSKLKFFPPIAKQNSSIKSVKLGSLPPLSPVHVPRGGAGVVLQWQSNFSNWHLAPRMASMGIEQSKSINQSKVCGNLLTTHLCALSALESWLFIGRTAAGCCD